jgi:hypothetical protein
VIAHPTIHKRFVHAGVVSELELLAKAYDPSQLVDNPKLPASGADKTRTTEQAVQRNRAFSALTALVRQNPERIRELLAKIRSGSPATRWLISGLASSGSAQAQEAMVSLLRDASLELALRKSVGLSLLQANQPTVASGKAVQALLDDPAWRQFAMYGMGTLARRLRDVGEVQAGDQLAQELTDRLTHARDQREVQDLLGGLANAAYNQALPAIRPYLDHQQPAVREAAVLALRLMQEPQIEPLLITRITSDEASEVRSAALGAAAKRELVSDTLTRAVSKSATTDPETTVRLAAVRVLGTWLPTRPTLRPLLQTLADHDPDANISLLAKAVLAKGDD